MVFRLEKKELKIIGMVALALFIFFGFFVDKFYSLASNNVQLYYFIFLFVYGFFILKYIFEENGFTNLRTLFAFILIFLSTDVLAPPILISKSVIPNLPIEAQFSSDLFLYNLLPNLLPHVIKYYFTYVVFPLIFLIIAAVLLHRKKFTDFIKGGI